MKNTIISVLVVLILFITPVYGQEKKTEKIIIEGREGMFSTYKYNTGERIIKLEAKYLEKIVFSIHDEEATIHLIRSQTLSSISKPLLLMGGLLIAIPIAWQIGRGDFDQLVFLSGCGITTTGAVLAFKSDRERLKSVERYNQVVEEKWGIFFQYLPKNKQLGLMLGHSF